MEKTHDYLYHYLGCWRSGGIHRIEIFQEEGRSPVIVCTASPENDSRIGVTVECLAAAVVREHFPASFEEIGEPFVWIAHHPPAPELGRPAAYQWVTFDSYAPRQVRHPSGARHVALGRARWILIDRDAIEETLRRPYAEEPAYPARPRPVLDWLADAIAVAMPSADPTGLYQLLRSHAGQQCACGARLCGQHVGKVPPCCVAAPAPLVQTGARTTHDG
jgi:hypothetical protein